MLLLFSLFRGKIEEQIPLIYASGAIFFIKFIEINKF